MKNLIALFLVSVLTLGVTPASNHVSPSRPIGAPYHAPYHPSNPSHVHGPTYPIGRPGPNPSRNYYPYHQPGNGVRVAYPAHSTLVHPPYVYNHFPRGTRVVNKYYYYNRNYYGPRGYYGYGNYGWYYSPYGYPAYWTPWPFIWAGLLVYSGPVILSANQNYTPPASVQPSNQVNVVADAQVVSPACPAGNVLVSSYLSSAQAIEVPGYGHYNPLQSNILQGWYITLCVNDLSEVSSFGQKFVTISVSQ